MTFLLNMYGIKDQGKPILIVKFINFIEKNNNNKKQPPKLTSMFMVLTLLRSLVKLKRQNKTNPIRRLV